MPTVHLYMVMVYDTTQSHQSVTVDLLYSNILLNPVVDLKGNTIRKV